MDKCIEELRKEKLKEIFKKKNLVAGLILVFLLILAWQIRTANVPNLKDVTTGDYTLGPDLDPWLFLRYAKSIVETGSIPQIDKMRYVPIGFDTQKETRLLPYMIACFHKVINIFAAASINYSGAMFPAFMFLLTVISFFLLTGKIFEEHKYRWWISGLASLFLIVSPSLLARTVAGIPEKESAGFFFMFLSFYFVLHAFKSDKIKRAMLFGGLAGLTTASMGLIWGGVIYIFTVMGIAGFFLWIFGKINKKEIFIYGLWIVLSFVLLDVLSKRYSLIGLATSFSSGISLAVFFLMIVDYLLFNTKIKDTILIGNLNKKYPEKLISFGVFVILGVVLSSVVFGIGFIPNFIGDIIFHLTQPYLDRLSFTVAENRQPFFNEWGDDFGPVLNGFPLFFGLFFFGSILLFYKTINLKKKDRIYTTLAYTYFLFALIFSRFSLSSIMNGTSLISKMFYFSGFAVFGLYLLYIVYAYEKRGEESMLKEFYTEYILLFSFFFISIVGARSAIRLIMVLAPPASIIAAFVPFEIFRIIKKDGVYPSDIESKKEKNWFLIISLILISLITVFTIYKLYNVTYVYAQSHIPSSYNQQWQKAMSWVRNNTSEDAVFSHWWDYGYWIQSIGERATVLDGGNFIPYWNHLTGRHVLTGQAEQEALEFLYTHNATHLLIDSTDIGKYPAYASIGSDSEYDRYSWLSTFIMNEKATKELRNRTEYYFEGTYLLDEDFFYKTNSSESLYPGRKSYIALIRIVMNEQEIENIEGYFVYQQKREWIPIKCVYYNGKMYEINREGYDGCLKIMPAIISSKSLNKIGAGIFLGSRVKRTNFARLYLFNQSENFRLVHTEDDEVVKFLRNQGFDITDFVFYNGIRGPIKIWEIKYPEDIKANPDYLKTDYPSQELSLAKPGFY